MFRDSIKLRYHLEIIIFVTTFFLQASYFAGNDQYQGEMFTEYGAIVPDTHV